MIDEQTEEQAFPDALHNTSTFTRVLCFCVFGRPGFQDHWESLQSKDTFENMRGRLCSILTVNTTAAGLFVATSGLFVTTSSPVYFDYASAAPYFLFLTSLGLAMIGAVTSGLSKIGWSQTDQQSAKKQLEQGGYSRLSYLSSIVVPVFFVGWSLNCFIFAMMMAGFYSQNTICRTFTAFWLIIYVVSIGTISVDLRRKYAKSGLATHTEMI